MGIDNYAYFIGARCRYLPTISPAGYVTVVDRYKFTTIDNYEFFSGAIIGFVARSCFKAVMPGPANF